MTGDAFQRVALPPNRPPGILGHAAYLTAHAQPENSSHVQRAFIIRERVLCQDLPPVPSNLDTNLDPAVEHRGNDMRFVFAGGAGGYLRTSPNGRYIDGGGDAHQRALFSIGEAMGVTSFTGFGATGGAPAARTALESLRA